MIDLFTFIVSLIAVGIGCLVVGALVSRAFREPVEIFIPCPYFPACDPPRADVEKTPGDKKP